MARSAAAFGVRNPHELQPAEPAMSESDLRMIGGAVTLTAIAVVVFAQIQVGLWVRRRYGDRVHRIALWVLVAILLLACVLLYASLKIAG